MNARSFLNKALLLIPVVLAAPLLASATPAPDCTGTGHLSPTMSVNFADTTLPPLPPFVPDAMFTCTGVTFPGPDVFGTDPIHFLGGTPGFFTEFQIFPDISFPPPFNIEPTETFTGNVTGGGTVQFFVYEGPGSGTETVSMSPEPGSILLFGTGLLIAGGFIRRRLVSQTVA
jgi:hypothetical protein